jgi:hypothetical protein
MDQYIMIMMMRRTRRRSTQVNIKLIQIKMIKEVEESSKYQNKFDFYLI